MEKFCSLCSFSQKSHLQEILVETRNLMKRPRKSRQPMTATQPKKSDFYAPAFTKYAQFNHTITGHDWLMYPTERI